MKDYVQKSGAILLALLVMLSTVSFTVDKHFCGKMLVDTAIFSEAHDCGMDMEMETSEMDEDSCCKDERVVVEGQDELKHSFENISFYDQLFLVGFTSSYLELFEFLPEKKLPFGDYSPPVLVTDIHLMNQVFLI